MKHISKEDFFKVFNVSEMKSRNKKMYNRIYNRVIKEWDTIEDWFNCEYKKIHIETRTTDLYWVAFGLINETKLPLDFLKELRLNNSKDILKKTLVDFKVIDGTIEKMRKSFSDSYVDVIYSIVVRICLYKGVNEFKKIDIADIRQAYDSGLLQNDGHRSRLAKLMYYSGYSDICYNDSNLYTHLDEQKRAINNYWSDEMKKYIKEYISDIREMSISSDKMEGEKIRGLNIYSEYYCSIKGIETILDLKDFDRKLWLSFIDYIRNNDNTSLKTKNTKLIPIRDFIKWGNIKVPDIVVSDEIFLEGDLKSTSSSDSIDNKSFGKREHGERILKYLLNDFKTDNIRDLFRKEALIIAANSGARISEIRRLEYGKCFFSEDEGVYKTIINYSDKLNRQGAPLYLTTAGYEAIKRVEYLRKNYDFLELSKDERVGRQYIKLFEYRGGCPIAKTGLYRFIDRIKKEIGLVNTDGKPVDGGAHAFRHFFGKTLFIESDYNIEVVRYFLRHKKYKMSFKYIQEEREELQEIVRSTKIPSFSGKALDTIVSLLLDSNETTIKKVLDNSKSLYDLIDSKKIKKVSFGYCINPCELADRCIRCNNHLLTSENGDEIVDSTNEIFELLCFKISLFNSVNEALESKTVHEDLLDLNTMIEEIKYLKIDYKELLPELKGVISNA